MADFQKAFDTLSDHFGSIDQVERPIDQTLYDAINAVSISGDQLERAFKVHGVLDEERFAALSAYAEREGLRPIGDAARALVLRLGLLSDFLEDPGIEPNDWRPMLEAIARVRLLPNDVDDLSLNDGGQCFDERHFNEMLEFAREMPW